ncbi:MULTISPECIES: hydroxysqualene dehydroxylase HpnE [unclassified Variovorax]|uniref:hydroxysqualene dehydroxylase HpnE n=1 Tax=unclassified Variovorax TaxID=663243 RepID=UPI00076CBCB5|nr:MULTISPECIES: hydroxysqualene dehydroxylase HpnE [unclassified Variovorax]KWT84305.1 Phytoene desaturase, pro-zeta-carotene producing [Variovorax sp. WDL1]PNG52793.1 15-cis-phytoene desaturase [Variovorax sp. B4]PNG55332.1 15-cis-phytoene desaturase [Variovorax sp. B2]VTV09074.1 15-cis-phytoene desaturase [Variovorax sp. WDL1]
MKKRVAVIGAGWAGLACAIEATRAGHAVTVFETARTLGGRARALPALLPNGEPVTLDNGQHILIGAYSATLGLMRELGIDPEAVLQRVPLTLRFADGAGLAVPAGWPPPLDLLAGILGARGWSWRDKAKLVRGALAWRASRFLCDPQTSVDQLCAGLTPRVRRELVEPLCISALNTPLERASGQVFLRVLHDALFTERGGADLLLPRVDLGALLPDAAAHWLAQHGTRLHTGTRVQAIGRDTTGWQVDGERFDRVVLACPPWEAARLAEFAGLLEAAGWSRSAQALEHEAIATVYVTGGAALPAPLLALRASPGAPAQFVFDRGQLGGPQGLLAFVVSASGEERDALQQQVLAQARAQLGLADLQPLLTVVEKRATFACTPGLERPPAYIAPGLVACGDYVEGPYPATIEGAVRSGKAAGSLAPTSPRAAAAPPSPSCRAPGAP